jgi:hypothetical protein
LLESRVLNKIFGPKREEVTGGWHNKELYNLYSFSDIISLIKSRTNVVCSMYGKDDEKF